MFVQPLQRSGLVVLRLNAFALSTSITLSFAFDVKWTFVFLWPAWLGNSLEFRRMDTESTRNEWIWCKWSMTSKLVSFHEWKWFGIRSFCCTTWCCGLTTEPCGSSTEPYRAQESMEMSRCIFRYYVSINTRLLYCFYRALPATLLFFFDLFWVFFFVERLVANLCLRRLFPLPWIWRPRGASVLMLRGVQDSSTG